MTTATRKRAFSDISYTKVAGDEESAKKIEETNPDMHDFYSENIFQQVYDKTKPKKEVVLIKPRGKRRKFNMVQCHFCKVNELRKNVIAVVCIDGTGGYMCQDCTGFMLSISDFTAGDDFYKLTPLKDKEVKRLAEKSKENDKKRLIKAAKDKLI